MIVVILIRIIIYLILVVLITIAVIMTTKRVLEYGVRPPVFYGNLREQIGENVFPQKPTENLYSSYRNLRQSPETSGNLRENVIQESCIPAPGQEGRKDAANLQTVAQRDTNRCTRRMELPRSPPQQQTAQEHHQNTNNTIFNISVGS